LNYPAVPCKKVLLMNAIQTWSVGQVGACLPSMLGALGLISSNAKTENNKTKQPLRQTKQINPVFQYRKSYV
jgi:hypothetical protein